MINIYQKKIRLCVYNSLVGVNVTVEHTHEGGGGVDRRNELQRAQSLCEWLTEVL